VAAAAAAEEEEEEEEEEERGEKRAGNVRLSKRELTGNRVLCLLSSIYRIYPPLSLDFNPTNPISHSLSPLPDS
jgi:hypothetical protein